MLVMICRLAVFSRLEWRAAFRVESREWRFILLVMVDRLEVFFPVRMEI